MNKKSIFYILLAAVLMGSTFSIQKIGLISVDTLFYLTIRFLIATIISFLFLRKEIFTIPLF
ncbi:EamA family transporter [Marinitoga sp. 38H-ov]|uniref:EamA family transporter n=1 Tax=Marinitoga sp. 38H-ov TaxID=1755814 RepID=UPI0013EA7228|nr:EamA family transporter [Marinitoga sp. 38H-ov]KAF2956290.1 hypothetical protein AS160_06145 [Marinitoga sp. 38H-ov]